MIKNISGHGLFTAVTAGIMLLWSIGFSETPDITSIFEKVDTHNPQNIAARHMVEAASAELDQAKLHPNPELEIGTENFGRAEIEVMLAQPLELGGKRKSRIASATMRHKQAALELEIVRLQVRAETFRRLGHLSAIENRIAVIDTMLALALSDKEYVDKRIQAGAAMRLDAIRSAVAVEEIRMERDALVSRRDAAELSLAAMRGDTSLTLTPLPALQGKPPEITADTVLQHMSEFPLLQRAAINVRMSEAERLQAIADAFPETAIHGGYLHNNESGENALFLGFSSGLPLFNRNQGAVSALTNYISSKKREHQAVRVEMKADIRSLAGELTSLKETIVTLEQKIIPHLSDVHRSLKKYYTRGLTGILDVLESRRALVEKELEAVDLRETWLERAADLYERSGILYTFSSYEHSGKEH